MEFKQVVSRRRSTRKFLPTPVEREKLQRIVDAALVAPTSRNTRSTRFFIVEDRATLERMSQMRDYGSAFMKDATAAIVVTSDRTLTDLWVDNCAIAATTIQLAIVDEGLASCWVHVEGRPRLKDNPEGEQAIDYLRTFIDIPEHWAVECAIALGYSDYQPKPLPEHDDSSSVIWHTKQ